MNKTRQFILFFTSVAIFIFLAGCNEASQNNRAATAVESYLRALVARDFNAMVSASCAAWEAQAKIEFDSFTAVKLNLKDLACKEIGKEGDYTLVSCAGSIIANYGAEDLEIDIANRPYKVVQEGGEWRMCGYQ